MSAADQTRFLALLQQHRGILYKVAQVHCQRREDRADLIQDIVLELWKAFPRYDAESPFATWMYRVGVNVAISFFRGESRRIRDALPIEDVVMDLGAADLAMASAEEDLADLHQLISQLDGVNRALILLYLEGYSQDEIADMVGISASNVGTRIQRIKQRLHEQAAETLS